MKPIEDFLQPTQKELFGMLRKMFKGKSICRKNSFVLVQGEAPIMLLAHLDTVHEKPVKHICKTADGNILMSPQGIGGDDRCGVYALVNVYEQADKKPWLLFTCDEEIGGRGAEAFCRLHQKGKLPKDLNTLKLLVEIDRRGSKDAVYYDCDNKDFEAYITGKGFQTEFGSFSDISYVAPELGVAAVNLSSGYYNAHTQHEFINRKQINAVIEKVVEIVAEAALPDFPKYEYVKRVHQPLVRRDYGYLDWGLLKNDAADDWGTVPPHLPVKYQQMYDELLDLYAPEELESFCEEYGNEIIEEIYRAEYGFMYGGGE
ncbi:MAG: hypothetical protein IJ741_07070 [Schwartzia sp.]|nr:hypothetical protein [Schwartzia sp. (in: firmicutes)]